MFSFPNKLEKQRLKLLAQVEEQSALSYYLEQPFPNLNTLASEIEFLALDFETTGLDANTDAVLSIGYTLINKGRIQLSENQHHLVKVNRNIPPQSIIIHKITDDRAEQGKHLHCILDELLSKMKGKVLLVHYDKIERNFISAACKKIYGYVPPLMIVDTLMLAKRRLDRLGSPYPPERLRLFNLRDEYNLPRYYAHSALEDAIATAELFLAQAADAGGLDKIKVKTII